MFNSRSFKCNMCGSDNSHTVRRYKRQAGIFRKTLVVQCASCKLLQAYPTPSEKDLFKFYEHEYRSRGSIGHHENRLPIRQESQIHLIKRELENLGVTPLNILDIGAGHGQLIFSLGELYPKANLHATEVDGACYLRLKQAGIEVRQVLFDQTDFPIFKTKFDLIVCSHVLEHALNPRVFLERISLMLESGGVLMLEVPNCGVPYCYGFDVPHLSFFTEHSLSSAVQHFQLKVIKLIKGGISAAEYVEAPTKYNLLKNFIHSCVADVRFLNSLIYFFLRIYRALFAKKDKTGNFYEKEEFLENKYRESFFTDNDDGTYLRILAIKS